MQRRLVRRSLESVHRASAIAIMVRVDRPRAVILDLRGVIANKNFDLYSDAKKSFYKANLRSFLEDDRDMWLSSKARVNLKHVYKMARSEQTARISAKTISEQEPILVPLNSTDDLDEAQEALRLYINWTLEHNPRDRATGLFLEQMQVWGYHQKLLQTPVYPDVLPFLKSTKDAGVAILMTGASDRAFDMVMINTTAGDLRKYFTSEGTKNGHVQINFSRKDKSFAKFDLLENKQSLLITHSHVIANKAYNSNMRVLMIVRPDIDPNWQKRISETSSKVHTVGSLPIIPVSDQIGHDSDPLETHDDSDRDSDDELKLHAVKSKITADDVKNFTVVKSLAEVQFLPVRKTSPKPPPPQHAPVRK